MSLRHFIKKVKTRGDATGARQLWQQLEAHDHPADVISEMNADQLEFFLAALEREPLLLALLHSGQVAPPATDPGAALHAAVARVGGRLRLRLQLVSLRATLDGALDPDDESARERYSELLEEYAPDGNALQLIRKIGQQLERLEADGKLPRTLIRRGQWRSRSD